MIQNGDSVIVLKELPVKRGSKDNIFTNEEKPFNKDYFKTLWIRYKAKSTILEDLQTLYSFRHTGALEVYKRTNKQTIYLSYSKLWGILLLLLL